MRHQIQAENPDSTHIQIMKMLSQKWKALGPEERAVYDL